MVLKALYRKEEVIYLEQAPTVYLTVVALPDHLQADCVVTR